MPWRVEMVYLGYKIRRRYSLGSRAGNWWVGDRERRRRAVTVYEIYDGDRYLDGYLRLDRAKRWIKEREQGRIIVVWACALDWMMRCRKGTMEEHHGTQANRRAAA